MTVATEELKALLDFSVRLSRGAGDITLKYFQRHPEASEKADGSLVTVADREAEAYLRKEILARFPEDTVLGEEEGESHGQSQRRWIVDPIDGTFAFVHGVPFYGVLIGLEIDNDVCLGVINCPAVHEVVYAAKGLGCYLNGTRAQVSSTSTLDEALLLCSDFALCEPSGFAGPAARLQQRVKASRTWGDCYGYVLVATGRADVMLDPVMNIWDCAALLPVLEEAGGTFTDWGGERTVTGGNSIATNGLLFDEVMQLVR